MTVTDELLENAARYADGFDRGDLPLPPAKRVAVLACMDARLNPAALLGLSEGDAHVIRNAGGVVTDDEIRELVDFVSAQGRPVFDPAIQTQLESPGAMEEEVTEEDEALVEKCLEIIRQERRASTSMLQRRLRLGYTRAARVVDILERRGILGPGEGAKPREILVDLDALV